MNKKMLAIPLVLLELMCPTSNTVAQTTPVRIPHIQYVNIMEKEINKEKQKEKTESTKYDIDAKMKFNIERAKFADSLMLQRIHSKYNIDNNLIQYALDEAKEYSNKKTMDEYYTIASLILATMEVESNFKMINCTNNNGTTDYGIMQVNTSIIPEIKKSLGNSVNELKYNTRQNVKAGTYEIMLCYDKASKKHPDNIIFWHYAYYNRGLYFENYSYDYNQMYKRSNKFESKFYKYYDLMI